MKELKPARKVVCHMNPLADHNIADVKLKTQRWEKLLGGQGRLSESNPP
jgi:hypothetical protein